MSTWYYYNTLNNKVSTTVKISMIRKLGPMSFCGAFSIEDQEGCKYREDATYAKHCLYYRPQMNGACDNCWAQAGVEMPKKVVEEEPAKKEDATKYTAAETFCKFECPHRLSCLIKMRGEQKTCKNYKDKEK